MANCVVVDPRRVEHICGVMTALDGRRRWIGVLELYRACDVPVTFHWFRKEMGFVVRRGKGWGGWRVISRKGIGGGYRLWKKD